MMGQDVHIRATEILARGKGIAKKVTFDYEAHDGQTVVNTREVYEIDDAVAVIPFDQERGTVLLTRQFRLPAWLSGYRGSLIEACAGKLEGEDPQTRILHEAEEELGYRLHDLQKAFDLFSSPGNTTETVSCYLALYSPANKLSEGGGLHEEGEHIEVLELPLEAAFDMVETGAIRDAKTVALLQHAQLRFAKSVAAPAFTSGR
ncbi:MAG: NUDIX domain-containing protein [Hyphomicrobiales bacterium]|nr:NUDIX domain-containing protein [Hyphomicrobiales bacterium]